MADPLAIAQTALGAFGMFGKKKSRAERLAEQQLDIQNKTGEEALRIARAYDPVSESRAVVDAATNAGAKAANTALTQQRMNFGGRIDDTRFIPIAQRAIDDPMNALYGEVARATSGATERKLSAMQMAMGIARPGELAAAYRAAPESNHAGSAAMLAQGVMGLMAKSPGGELAARPAVSASGDVRLRTDPYDPVAKAAYDVIPPNAFGQTGKPRLTVKAIGYDASGLRKGPKVKL